MPSVVLLLPLGFAKPKALTWAMDSDSSFTTSNDPPSPDEVFVPSTSSCCFLADSVP
ncbi:hypothetical protein OCU04_006822 [Sclerotinia nivalis]|uniref:Uncharacterized protein n=1 Tax=Sclerotinia nivalis TaxID=352851 RepID=A0A9X0DIT6_9HELO|nr:hypothetical protein OCU04_006822 [Sclerotinia nivalis]